MSSLNYVAILWNLFHFHFDSMLNCTTLLCHCMYLREPGFLTWVEKDNVVHLIVILEHIGTSCNVQFNQYWRNEKVQNDNSLSTNIWFYLFMCSMNMQRTFIFILTPRTIANSAMPFILTAYHLPWCTSGIVTSHRRMITNSFNMAIFRWNGIWAASSLREFEQIRARFVYHTSPKLKLLHFLL